MAEKSPVAIATSLTSAVIDQWEIQYARFVRYSSTSVRSAHPSLTPLKTRQEGTWISTLSVVSLKLIFEQTADGLDDAVLLVSLQSRALEEHHVSKMSFSWPQVSCVSGFPARGSRAVFVSYKDSIGQIQKFALHFFTIFETEKFMNVLKNILEDGRVQQLEYPGFNSEMSSHSEVVPCDGLTCRSAGDWECNASAETSSQLMLPATESDAVKEPFLPEVLEIQEAAETIASFPPSFTQLLRNCNPVANEAKPKEPEEDLKTQFMRYLEGTSLQEIMATVENVINELGCDIVL